MATAYLRRLLQAILLLVIVLLVSLRGQAGASSIYGRGGYDSCGYNEVCTSVPPTIITLPPSLDIAVNLQDGQVVPNDTYDITATPLNGHGSSFDHIDFYVDDRLIATISPDSTGTASWTWDTHDNPGTAVKLVVTGTDGQAVTKTYHVRIAPAAGPKPATAAATRQAKSPVENALNGVTHIIAALPRPLIRTVPYGLFFILLVNFVLLVLQLRKEIREYGLAKRLLAQQRDIVSTKHVLLQLLSHYLRTPLTIIKGGVDMMTVEQSAWQRLERSLSERIESLIGQLRAEAAVVDELPAVRPQASRMHFWQRPGLFVPIVLIGLVAAVFDYLAHRASRLDVSRTGLAVQASVFFTLAVLTYVAFRFLRLRLQDARELERTMAAEAGLSQARDDLLAEAAGLLQRTIEQVAGKSAGLPAGQSKEFIRQGSDQLTLLLQKFQLAASVRGSHDTKPFTVISLQELVDRASASLAETAVKRRIRLPEGTSQAVLVRDPDLLVRVVASLLDNAVAYSPDGASIELSYVPGKDGASLTITDHGKGIPADRLNTLFAPFQKLEGAETFNHEGMGFSLYLDRLMMTYLGGSISVVSPRGGGTRVTLTLPNA